MQMNNFYEYDRMQGLYDKDTILKIPLSADNLWPCGRLLACKCTFGPGLCHGRMGRFGTAGKNGKDGEFVLLKQSEVSAV